MERNTAISVKICLLFFVIYIVLGSILYFSFGTPNNTNDFKDHFDRLNGSKKNYLPLYQIMFSPFGKNVLVFWGINLFVATFIIPFLLFRLTKTFWAIILYFCGISFFHQIIYSATFPMLLIMVYLLVYFNFRKNIPILLFLTILANYTHSAGLQLFLIIIFAELTIYYGKRISYLFTMFFLTGKIIPAKAEIGYLTQQSIKSDNGIINIFTIMLPLPIFLIALKKSGVFFGILIIASFFAAINDLRGLVVAELCCIILASQEIQYYSINFKKWIIIALIFNAIFYLFSFWLETYKLIVLN